MPATRHQPSCVCVVAGRTYCSRTNASKRRDQQLTAVVVVYLVWYNRLLHCMMVLLHGLIGYTEQTRYGIPVWYVLVVWYMMGKKYRMYVVWYVPTIWYWKNAVPGIWYDTFAVWYHGTVWQCRGCIIWLNLPSGMVCLVYKVLKGPIRRTNISCIDLIYRPW